jgi:hypothetical protein
VRQHADDAAASIDALAAEPAVLLGFVDEVPARP